MVERILFCGLTSLSLAGKPYIIRTGFAVAAAGYSAESSAEIIHERGMNGRLAFFAGFAKTLGNRTETGHETGQEIAVEKFLKGTHGISLILFFLLAGRIYFAQAAVAMGNFA
ncbi:hypothetical protein [Rhizobium phaseoli]|uniref:hypothetical protein n=1 Tax=Rhizobium phaseoli TaxID=396 RepID=UPI001680AE1C|nr:hypothetical protein [Rhizobium phaseoli]